ncbi:MAG: uracil-DNA glycosylase family protein [Nitrospiraceae bacterium]|jgi:uracil-DNA glycosylase|uniref:Uracil-DNA glycosylase n=1 Tax=Nitrospira moscoviensis TaxID=42253 RepID=A0A0K2G6D9_NITMO|nr:uracil-DNA glycosylase family protein [Nitrospira moscoviensis]ALA56536.1 Uracil-DNA glycosylase [Nitrospira moscoviensis]ALA61057.1 Uracil-DNA glycosylase [Nitrospira moscoviensis]MBX9660513.1 uracil-DNA glycosylase family protein [Nitrospiraceae bacterium]
MAQTMKKRISLLLQDIQACTICQPTLPLGPRPILQIHPKASILIAGQAPGRKAHETRVPFDDPSGDRLREWLGVNRKTFYDAHQIAILPMGFCYPGAGKSGDLPPRPECASAWRAELLAMLPNIKLTLVIGQYALDYHLQESPFRSVTEAVKAWKEFWPDRLPLPHPSPRNNIWLKRNLWFEHDLLPVLRRRVKTVLRKGTILKK